MPSAFLYHVVFHCLCVVTLSPDHKTTLACVSGSVQFNCIAPVSAFWRISGFLDKATNFEATTGADASRVSPRINTSDGLNPVVAVSSITISNFSYGDQGAIIECVNGMDVNQREQTRIVVG